MLNDGARITVLLVDDQSIILDGIESILAAEGAFTVIGRAGNGREAVERARDLDPDVVLMDINMPGMDGVAATKKLLKVNARCKVLVLSMHGHKEFVLEVLDSGASGYLLKTTHKAELIEALKMVASGKTYVASELRPLLTSADRFKDRRGADTYGALTKREVQIVKLIVRERTSQEIADALFISVPTVETHRRNIMHKLDVRNTAGLVKYAMQRGWDA
ncbi:MAG: response regulator transcription factor [Flavobacteriales bacterium]|nr:response regulator transcription factor [Flavobacteriales bacterium]